jgi:polyribonucleotide nucleotidyltransferase
MIGHGNLAERALRPVFPPHTAFPYAVRVYAECTSSNGSSSMASACAATLALMDAGVPIKAPVAGVSIGLVTAEDISSIYPVIAPATTTIATAATTTSTVESSANAATTTDISSSNSDINNKAPKYVLLTDILGTEDHYGDMDFKVAGTAQGITAVQLDVKLQDGVPVPILEEALDRAKEARLQILEAITAAILKPRVAVKPTAPRAEVVRFDPERKIHLVGRGGEMIRFIEEEYQCEVDTTEEGVAYIFGADERSVKDARMLVQDLVAVAKEGG